MPLATSSSSASALGRSRDANDAAAAAASALTGPVTTLSVCRVSELARQGAGVGEPQAGVEPGLCSRPERTASARLPCGGGNGGAGQKGNQRFTAAEAAAGNMQVRSGSGRGWNARQGVSAVTCGIESVSWRHPTA
jgi:hypothetical protein